MNSQIILLLGILLAFFGAGLVVFFACRAVLWARRKREGSEFAGALGLGSVLNPAEALIEERQRVKRSDEESGDPEELKS